MDLGLRGRRMGLCIYYRYLWFWCDVKESQLLTEVCLESASLYREIVDDLDHEDELIDMDSQRYCLLGLFCLIGFSV